MVYLFPAFRFSEHEKRKDQNDLKPHYKIAPKGAGLPYQICELLYEAIPVWSGLSKYTICRNNVKGAAGTRVADKASPKTLIVYWVAKFHFRLS